MTIALKGRYLAFWAASAVVAAACGGDENNAGGSSSSECDPTDPACYGTDGWGQGGAGPVGAAGGAPARPANCGNGVLDSGEACDGAQLGGATCASGTMGANPNGTVGCSFVCQLVFTGCTGATPGGTGGTGTGGRGNGTGGNGTGGR